MSTIETRGAGSALAIRSDQTDWTAGQGQALLEMFNLGNAPISTIQSYFHICQTTGLDPFKRQIHLIERSGKWTPQTSIDGFRIIRDRAGVYDGDETFWCGDDGVWVDAWIKPEPPTASMFKLYVKGRSRPVTAVARWVEYVQTKGNGQVTHMWAKMAAHMLAKVAEALAIRKAFPDDTGGLYTDDEMAQASNDGGQASSSGRQRSPGIMDLETPAAAAPEQTFGDPGVGGGFMNVAPPAAAPAAPEAPQEDPNIEDAVIVPDEPQQAPPAAPPAAPPVQEAAPAPEMGEPMNMQPEAESERTHQFIWAEKLAVAMETPGFDVYSLRAVYDEAAAAGALGEPIPWGLENFDATVMAIKANLDAGLPMMQGVGQ